MSRTLRPWAVPAGWALPAGCYLSFAALGLALASLGPALPFLAQATGSGLARISVLFVAQNVGYMAGSYGGGVLYDRARTTRVVGLALFAMAALLAVVPVAPILPVLALAFGALGAVQGAVDVGGNVLILRTPQRGRQVRLNALHAFFGLGALLAPVAMAQSVARTGTVSAGYWALALLALPAAAWMVRLPDPPHTVAPPGAAHGNRRLPLVAVAGACIFLIVAAEAGFGSWIYTYSVTRGLADKVQAAYLNSVYWGGFALGRVVATAVSLRVRPKALILIGLAGCLGGTLALLLPGGGPASAWTAAACVGFFLSPLFANTLTLTGEVLHISGRVAGVFLVATSLGGLFLPWLVGQLFQPVGPQVLPVALIVAFLAAGAFYALLLRRAHPARRAV